MVNNNNNNNNNNNTINFKEQKKMIEKKQRFFKHRQYKSKVMVVFQTMVLLAMIAALCHYCTTNY